jgi:hypothetical protein
VRVGFVCKARSTIICTLEANRTASLRAVRVGFEPTVTVRLHSLSKRARSASPAPHLVRINFACRKKLRFCLSLRYSSSQNSQKNFVNKTILEQIIADLPGEIVRRVFLPS